MSDAFVENLIDSDNARDGFDLVAYLYRFPWFPAESPFGEDAEFTERLAGFDLEALMELDETIGRIAAAARGAQQLLREEFRRRVPSGKIRFGDQVYGVSRSARWEVVDDDVFWTALEAMTRGSSAEDTLAVVAKILPTRNVRVTALRAEAQRAGIDPQVIDDTILDRRWSESLSSSWRPVDSVPAARHVDPEGGIVE